MKKSTVKSGGMANDVTPTGDVLSVKPLKYEGPSLRGEHK